MRAGVFALVDIAMHPVCLNDPKKMRNELTVTADTSPCCEFVIMTKDIPDFGVLGQALFSY